MKNDKAVMGHVFRVQFKYLYGPTTTSRRVRPLPVRPKIFQGKTNKLPSECWALVNKCLDKLVKVERATYSIRAIFALEYGIGFFWVNGKRRKRLLGIGFSTV